MSRLSWRGRGRLRLKPMRERNPVTVGLVGLVLLGLIGFAALNLNRLPLLGGGTRYTAYFHEAAGLAAGDEVRIAGVRVGRVDEVSLAGDKVAVRFTVQDAWVGDASTAAIGLKTLLGDKYIALDPLGSHRQEPGTPIALGRTTSPYDVTEAFGDLSGTLDEIDTEQLAKSFEAISATFADSPPAVRKALAGMSALSKSISSRDAQLADLLKGSNTLTANLAKKKSSFEQLLDDGAPLLGELKARRTAIKGLLSGTRALGTQLGGVIDDNDRQLTPTLESLGRVTDVLVKNQKGLDRTLAALGPYYRLVGNTLGNGRWLDSYLCGVVPRNYLPEGTPPEKGCMPPKKGGGA